METEMETEMDRNRFQDYQTSPYGDIFAPEPCSPPPYSVEIDYSIFPSPQPAQEMIDMLVVCLEAWEAIQDPEPTYMDDIGFNFKLVFRPWLARCIPAWPEGSMRENYIREKFLHDIDNWVDVYRRVESGPPILAFICKEGVIVACERASHTIINFNAHVIGCIAGDVANHGYLPCEGTASQVSKELLLKHSSLNGKGSSGIVIAGWDTEGPSLYRLDGEGKLHQGVIFACGSCAEYGYNNVSLKTFPYMSITTAAKLARISIPTAIVESICYSGVDASGFVISENGEIGDFVKVHCVDKDGCKVVANTDEDTDETGVDTIKAGPEPKRLKT